MKNSPAHVKIEAPGPTPTQLSPDNPNDQLQASARWTGEFATLVLSVLIEGALIGILVWMNGEPYFEKWKAPLSINTVVAILTTASKTALMHSVGSAIGQIKWVDYQAAPQKLSNFEIYDECSRGPGGAVRALFQLPRSILVLGALVTLLGLGVDPFTQQVVQLNEVEMKTLDESVKIDFAVDYNTFPRQSSINTFTKTDGKHDERAQAYSEIINTDPGIRAAITKGVFGIGSSPEFFCPGVCAWESTYHSIGFTSSCENVTQATAKTKICGKPGSKLTCDMTTPGGVALRTNHDQNISTTILNLNTTWSLDFLNATSGAVAAPDLLKIGVFRSTSGQDRSSSEEEIIDEDVTECTLSLIMHQFEGIRSNGTFNDAFFYNTTDEGLPLPVTITLCQQDLINMLEFFDSSSFRSDIVSGNLSTESGVGVALVNADIPAIMRTMADGMSQYVRAGTVNRRPANGFLLNKVVFVNVIWQWIVLPLFVHFLAIVFIVWVIWKNHHGEIPLWRSSALALILHSYDKERQLLIAPDFITLEKASEQSVIIRSK
ncbi:hypothetical protein NUW58_g7097 [Xylaria curta]|uniref:Uncharacterized protein n=1 Tax=Xylaria curta TaxID=42375 RepID=A0ACC1NKP7_9PEZI|nr:hypothetical protein NUW58_g7097 [Xylaria curta]